MKRVFLTLFFGCYYFFMPFVMVNCDVKDEPYALQTDASASESESETAPTGAYTLEECQEMEFLIEDCISILQEEEDRIKAEKSTVSAGADVVSNFESCQLEENISPATVQELQKATTDDADGSSDAEEDDAQADDSSQDDSSTDGTDQTDSTGSDDSGDDEDSEDTENQNKINCHDVITDIISAYQICDELTKKQKYPGCDDVEDVIDEAVEKCDSEDEEVTEDFCGSLTA